MESGSSKLPPDAASDVHDLDVPREDYVFPDALVVDAGTFAALSAAADAPAAPSPALVAVYKKYARA